jgi:NAD(P)-dependent dehydrogenase (short-subunit alcohol dehydrogenase family)
VFICGSPAEALMELSGTALITGGAHRLGRAIGLSLAEAGMDVAFTYLASAAAARETVRALQTRGARALALRADAADDRQMRVALARVRRDLGPIRLWVANAGVFRRTPLATVSEADWDDMMRLNFATFSVPAARIGPRMRADGGGCIVALADVAALRPWADYIPYCVAKRCVAAYVQALAKALAPRVRVNAIAPGPVLFPPDYPAAARARELARTALRREGDPRHVAEAVRALAANDYVTGAILPVDGGRLLA